MMGNKIGHEAETKKAEALALGSRYLLSYSKLQWPDYIIAKHHAAIAKCLEAVALGHLKRLIINIQPRAGKTKLTAENFIPFYLGRNPTHQVIYTTYAFDRAGDVGRAARNQMADSIYSQIFPGVSLSDDSKGANKFSTNQGGVFHAVGVGGIIVGRGAHLLIIDDPVKGRKEAESLTMRTQLENWYQGNAYTRLMPGGAIIVIMTRWHYSDLAGWLQEEHGHENWYLLNIPTIAESDDDALGRKPGDYLWPDYYSPEVVETIKKTIGTREWNAQYQQRPLPEEGGMLNLGWFKRYDYKPEVSNWIGSLNGDRKYFKEPPFGIKQIVLSWDTAFKESQLHDPSAGTVWGIRGKDVFLLDVFNKQMNYPDLRKKTIDMWSKYSKAMGKPCKVLIEDKASGQSLIQDLKFSTTMPIIPIHPDGNKQFRFSEATDIIEQGHVWLPNNAPWLTETESQLVRFPAYRFDDIVDSVSQFLRWVRAPRFINRPGILFWK